MAVPYNDPSLGLIPVPGRRPTRIPTAPAVTGKDLAAAMMTVPNTTGLLPGQPNPALVQQNFGQTLTGIGHSLLTDPRTPQLLMQLGAAISGPDTWQARVGAVGQEYIQNRAEQEYLGRLLGGETPSQLAQDVRFQVLSPESQERMIELQRQQQETGLRERQVEGQIDIGQQQVDVEREGLSQRGEQFDQELEQRTREFATEVGLAEDDLTLRRLLAGIESGDRRYAAYMGYLGTRYSSDSAAARAGSGAANYGPQSAALQAELDSILLEYVTQMDPGPAQTLLRAGMGNSDEATIVANLPANLRAPYMQRRNEVIQRYARPTAPTGAPTGGTSGGTVVGSRRPVDPLVPPPAGLGIPDPTNPANWTQPGSEEAPIRLNSLSEAYGRRDLEGAYVEYPDPRTGRTVRGRINNGTVQHQNR